MKNYDENKDGNIGYYLEVDVECPKELHYSYSDLLFLPER